MAHLSEERVAEIRGHGMRLCDFKIGMEFLDERFPLALQRYRHVGRIDRYAVCEHPIDQHDFIACSLIR
jgi:hypothetical protein